MRVGPECTDRCPYRDGWETRRAEQSRGHVTAEAEVGAVLPGAPRSWKSRGRVLLRASGGSVALPTPWRQTSGLQNGDRINFCCSEPPAYGHWSWQRQKLVQAGPVSLLSGCGPERPGPRSPRQVGRGLPALTLAPRPPPCPGLFSTQQPGRSIFES